MIDRKRDRSSFFDIKALRRNLTTPRSSLLDQQSSCIDPSASEEHGIEEDISFNNNISFPLPARSLFSAHEEVLAAFSAGQRKLEQRMSLQQRRASIAEGQRKREAHMEILEQHFGRRFLRKALTIVEESDKLLAEKIGKSRPAGIALPPSQEDYLDSVTGKPSIYNNDDDHILENIYANSFTPTTHATTSSTSSSPAHLAAVAASFTLSFEEPVVEEENDFYIEWDTLYGSPSSSLLHTEFSIGARSTPEDLETVAAF